MRAVLDGVQAMSQSWVADTPDVPHANESHKPRRPPPNINHVARHGRSTTLLPEEGVSTAITAMQTLNSVKVRATDIGL